MNIPAKLLIAIRTGNVALLAASWRRWRRENGNGTAFAEHRERDMTRDEPRELMKQALEDCCDRDGVLVTSNENVAEYQLERLAAAGFALVPREATDAMIQHAHCHSFISTKINAAIAAGNILEDGK